MIVFHIGALILALVVTPWLLAQRVARTSHTAGILASWGPVMVGLNIIVPITLHLLHIDITANTLSVAHLIPASIAIGISCLGGKIESEPLPRPFLVTAIIFAALILPFTHIAGIDTYKWQDLAGSVATEGRIAWLIHPLSLLGFTPRSYSSAQPLVLATIEILGHTSVDWGFYILSLAFGITGLAGAWMLGRRLFGSDRLAGWFAVFYLLSPVFMRYNFWATGRGLLLALLPLYLLILLRLSSRLNLKSILYNFISLLFLSLLLALSHKAGLIGIILIPLLFLISPFYILVRGRWSLLLALVAVLAIGLTVAGGNPATLGYRLLTRFGGLIPLAILGLYSAPHQFRTPAARAMLAGGFAMLILSCTPDMYGALLALPFITFIAVTGFATLPARPFMPLIMILTGFAALGVVVNQSQDSPDESVYQAAQFLEQHDPKGPYRIEAPGRTRTRMQAYVSGCPRFTVEPGTEPELAVARPPQWTGKLSLDARHWIDYLRRMIDLRGSSTDWYGGGNKVYYITIAGEGNIPRDAKLLFTHGTVKVFGNP
jgi:hypothetical protein